MVVKRTVFRGLSEKGNPTQLIMLDGGPMSYTTSDGKHTLHLFKHCAVEVGENHPLAQMLDGATVKGRIDLIEEESVLEVDENGQPICFKSVFAFREDLTQPYDYRTKAANLVQSYEEHLRSGYRNRSEPF